VSSDFIVQCLMCLLSAERSSVRSQGWFSRRQEAIWKFHCNQSNARQESVQAG